MLPKSRTYAKTIRFPARIRNRVQKRARTEPCASDSTAGIAGEGVTAVTAIGAAVMAPHALDIQYPDELPISQHRQEIADAIRENQVVVVAGETGSGKTTQLPKICLDATLGLGRGDPATTGMVGHTQPRRLAARTVAERIAEELHSPLGETVGYTVRFTDRASGHTRIRLMTDGILLAETRRDPELRRYDTLIIDEAHERSLNIDFLLGYLTRLLPRRPDLKLIITSATIDPQRFARHFSDAPVLEVSGRLYPVEVRYRPYGQEPDDDRDQTQAVLDAVSELERAHPGGAGVPGDVLVFLSGEREIRDTADALRDWLGQADRHNTEVLPLYARLSVAEQHRAFTPHPGRRIVLATNVAETSLTVPGIRYVVDPGTARISRYSRRTKVQRLPIEPVSQASATQRSGRCGRLSDGICIRLYSEADFEGRPPFTDPEILRTNLAAVLLQMADLRLGDVASFPFLDPPDRRAVQDGVALLVELGALEPATPGRGDGEHRLTKLGRRLARIPLDPRLGRMLLEAHRLGCLAEVLVIVTGLAIQDPRERPAEASGVGGAREAALQQHARFAVPGSDFLSYLLLWDYLAEQQRELSSSAFRRLCRREYLHYLRVREWQDLHGQVRRVLAEIGMRVPARRPGAEFDDMTIHRSLLAGLLSQIGVWDPDTREYLGARGVRFRLSPGSRLARKPPRWVMAAELVETTRLWAHTAARIEPEWVEPLAAHLVQRSYSEPRWSRRRGEVRATESVSLYGLPLVTGRSVSYGRVDPVVSRELFLRHALVEGDWDTRHEFVAGNLARRAELAEIEARTRRRGLVVDDEELFELYDARVPASVVSARHFDTWWKKARRRQPDLLTFGRQELLRPGVDTATQTGFPDAWPLRHTAGTGGSEDERTLALTYHFEPGAPDDGVTLHVPVGLLPQLSVERIEWLVPGLREELVVGLLRSLPKALRRSFVPAGRYATAVLERLEPEAGSLLVVLAHELTRMGAPVSPADFDLERLEPHLRMTVRVEDASGKVLAQGKDLARLQRQLAPAARASVAGAAGDLEQAGLTDWSVGTLPRSVEVRQGGHLVTGYPALVDERGRVAVRVLLDPGRQARAMRLGTRRLLLLTLPSPASTVVSRLDRETKLALLAAPHPSASALLEDCRVAAVDALLGDGDERMAWDEPGFRRLQEHVVDGLEDTMSELVPAVARVLESAVSLRAQLDALAEAARRNRDLAEVTTDVTDQLDGLVFPGFVTATGQTRLADLPRYLAGARRRLQRLQSTARPEDTLARDLRQLDLVHELEDSYTEAVERLSASDRSGPRVTEVRWMLQELRVSLFAQELGTRQPVSEKRVRRALAEMSAHG